MKLKKSSWSGGVIGTASVAALPPRTDGNGSPYIPLVYQFPVGGGHSISSDSSLVRPFRKLFEDGEPIGKINFIFYTDNNNNYIIGSVANTTKRLIFFPGLTVQKIIESPIDDREILRDSLYIDHLSLDKNWEKFHFTLKEKNKKTKLKARKTKKLKDESTFWFLMAVKSLDKLEKMPKSQEYRLSGPNMEDLKRRQKEFVASRENSIFHVTQVGGTIEPPWYLNLEFFLSNKTLGDYREEVPKPDTIYHTTMVNDPSKKLLKDFHTRFHFVRLPEFDGRLWLRVSRMPGILLEDGYYIPGSDWEQF